MWRANQGGGGGLFITLGDRVAPATYAATMSALLPQPLADPIDVTWGVAPSEHAARALHLSKWDTDHAIFAPFGVAGAGIADARFRKVVLLGPATDGDRDRKQLAQFHNGATALVERVRGAGRVVLLTSTIDRDWNDLAIQPGFLPLMQRLAHYLARKDATAGPGDHLIGQSVPIPIADAVRLEVRGPVGPPTVFERERLIGRKLIRFEATHHPGLYRVLAATDAGTPRPVDELAFAVNVDPRGSDLRVAPPELIPTSGTGSVLGPPTTERRVELWHAVAAALLLLLLIESLLTQR